MTREAFSQSIADWIRDGRRELRMTQLALGVAIGVKRSTIVAWESGSRTVSAYHYTRLESYFQRRKDGACEAAQRAKP